MLTHIKKMNEEGTTGHGGIFSGEGTGGPTLKNVNAHPRLKVWFGEGFVRGKSPYEKKKRVVLGDSAITPRGLSIYAI